LRASQRLQRAPAGSRTHRGSEGVALADVVAGEEHVGGPAVLLRGQHAAQVGAKGCKRLRPVRQADVAPRGPGRRQRAALARRQLRRAGAFIQGATGHLSLSFRGSLRVGTFVCNSLAQSAQTRANAHQLQRRLRALRLRGGGEAGGQRQQRCSRAVVLRARSALGAGRALRRGRHRHVSTGAEVRQLREARVKKRQRSALRLRARRSGAARRAQRAEQR